MSKTSVQPAFDSFSAAYGKGRPQLVWTKLVVDLETPVSAMLKLMDPGEPCFLLESVEGGEARGRYSIVGLKPDIIWRCFGDKAQLSPGTLAEKDFTDAKEPALASLRTLLASSHIDIPADLPPMSAGLIGYLGYDTVRLMESVPDKNPDTLGIPDGCLMRPQIMAIFDAVAGVVYIVTPVWIDKKTSARSEYGAAQERIEHIAKKFQANISLPHYQDRPPVPLHFASNIDRADYHAMVEKAKDYITAGDIFQVVPSQRFSAPFTLPHFSLYRALRHLNPSPFLFYLNFGNFSLVGASPEILVRLRDGKVTIRPIAGTRKRGKTREEDAALAENLLADPKELAEHLMLLDLGRNDVSRVAKTGTVKVTEHMKVERYSHVMHIVSNVEGELSESHDTVDALMAGFPAGTVSGAPKIRAMEIIDELEPVRRSFYGGCVGYFSASGAMDTCIALRTGLIKDGMLYIQAGGGVVADSDPDAEYEETVNKAKALMRAAERAGQFV